MTNIIPIILLLFVSLLGVKSIYVFCSSNGLFDLFGAVLNGDTIPGDIPYVAITTNGWSPGLDWQLKAPVVFFWPFAGSNPAPDVALYGLLFVGAWGSAWMLIVMESLRSCNHWRIISFVSVWGILTFNNAHAVVSPIYLALHLFTSPSAYQPTREGIAINIIDLKALPASFAVAYVFPIILLSLPASITSMIFKQTAMAWYQQWSLYVALAHWLFATITNLDVRKPQVKDVGRELRLSRGAYGFGFALTAVPYWTVMVLSCTASIWPELFREETANLLQPFHLFVPQNPFSTTKAESLSEGFFWAVQWDYICGACAMTIWASILHLRASEKMNNQSPRIQVIWKILLYTLIGGPASVAVGLIWERDEAVLKNENIEGKIADTSRTKK